MKRRGKRCLGSIRDYFEDDQEYQTVLPKMLEVFACDNSSPGPDGVRYSHLKSLSEDDIMV